MLEDDGKFYPPKPATGDSPPILNYRPKGAARLEKPARGWVNRSRSIKQGVAAVWGCFIFATMLIFGGSVDAARSVLAVGALSCLCFSIADFSSKKHAGFFVGVLLGALTVLGVAILTIGIICGAFK